MGAALLAEVSEILASSLDFEATLPRVVQLCVPQIADWCSVQVVDEYGDARQVAFDHVNPAKIALFEELGRRYPADPSLEHAAFAVLRSGEPELRDAIDVAKDSDPCGLPQALDARSAMIVPMIARQRVHGVITLGAADGDRRFDSGDLDVALQIAQRAALAIDNARLYERERRARAAIEGANERLSRLQRVTAELAAALTAGAIAEIAIDHGVSAVGAATGGIWTLESGADHAVMLRSLGFPDAAVERFCRVPTAGPAPLADSIRRRVPVFIESRDDFAARYADSELRTRDVMVHEVQGIACLPLVAGDAVLGAIAFAFRGERHFAEDERRFLMVLADHCAQALSRAALYEAERSARAEAESARAVAERASEAREHLLATVAHDLRNLLHAAEMRSAMMLRSIPDDAVFAWVKEEVQAAQRSSEGMRRLIDDLLDAAALDAGRLSVQVRPYPLGSFAEEVLETARLLAADRDVEIDASMACSEASLLCDRERLLQVVANVIGNAVKFTPRKGSVSLELGEQAGEVELTVRDRGPGIPLDELPRVFDRYWKGGRDRPGVGLGLFISKGLIEAQGGRIRIESATGIGTSVITVLPCARPGD
jgi:signal transduction histidine kinase